MKNKKNIRKLKFDRSVRPAVKAVPESGNPMYHEERSVVPRPPVHLPPPAAHLYKMNHYR